jgi:hypothetical protein
LGFRARCDEQKQERQTLYLSRFIHSFHWIHTLLISFTIQANKEGIINVTGKSLPSKPSYGHICKRIDKLSVNIYNGHVKKDDDDDGYIIIAADSTGIKVTNIEVNGWMRNGGVFLTGNAISRSM